MTDTDDRSPGWDEARLARAQDPSLEPEVTRTPTVPFHRHGNHLRDAVIDVCAILALALVVCTICVTVLKWHEADKRCVAYVAQTQLQNYDNGPNSSWAANACDIGRHN